MLEMSEKVHHTFSKYTSPLPVKHCLVNYKFESVLKMKIPHTVYVPIST